MSTTVVYESCKRNGYGHVDAFLVQHIFKIWILEIIILKSQEKCMVWAILWMV